MKNIFTTLILCCIGMVMMAQGTSTLIIFSEDGLPFDLMLNGVKQNEKHETNIRVEGLTQPYYSVKVLFKEKTLDPLEKKQLIVQDMDGKHAEATYVIRQDKKGRFKLKYYSAIPIESAPPATDNTTTVEFTTTPRVTTSVSVTETTTTISENTGVSSGSEEVDIDVSMGGMDVGMDVDINVDEDGMGMNVDMEMGMDVDIDMDMNVDIAVDEEFNSSTTVKTTTTTTTEENVGMETIPVRSTEPCSDYHMSEFDFTDALQSIAKLTHEDSKLTLAKQISDANCFTSLQVGEIMKAFAHESTRLEFATHAYPRTFDKNNYYKVNGAFQFESSIDDLKEALGL